MKRNKKLTIDLVIIAASIAVGVVLLKTGFVMQVLAASADTKYLGVFIAGLMFTSVFTTAPATVALAELSLVTSLPHVVLIGALGALCGDIVIFRFFRETILKDLSSLFAFHPSRRWKKIFHSRIFKTFLTLVGGIIIASPLPDELGLAFMGISKTNNFLFGIISFSCNAAGILAIALVARAIAV